MRLQARISKAEQSVRLIQTAQEWETRTDPTAVARQFQEAAERLPLCNTAQEVFDVLTLLPSFDPDIMDRCNKELLPLIPDALILACIELQDEQMRPVEVRDKARRALREGRHR